MSNEISTLPNKNIDIVEVHSKLFNIYEIIEVKVHWGGGVEVRDDCTLFLNQHNVDH